MNWMEQANCRGADTTIFYKAGNPAEALRLCWGDEGGNPECPVRQQCLDFACRFTLEEDSFGIFGGATPPERRRYRKGQPVKVKTYGRKKPRNTGPAYRGRTRIEITGFEHEGLR